MIAASRASCTCTPRTSWSTTSLRQAEYTWFALSDTIPGVSSSAESAARALWNGVIHGDPEVVVGWNARLAILAHNLLPGWTAEALSLINRALPSTDQPFGPSIRCEDLEGKIPETLTRMIPPGTRPRLV